MAVKFSILPQYHLQFRKKHPNCAPPTALPFGGIRLPTGPSFQRTRRPGTACAAPCVCRSASGFGTQIEMLSRDMKGGDGNGILSGTSCPDAHLAAVARWRFRAPQAKSPSAKMPRGTMPDQVEL